LIKEGSPENFSGAAAACMEVDAGKMEFGLKDKNFLNLIKEYFNIVFCFNE